MVVVRSGNDARVVVIVALKAARSSPSSSPELRRR